MEEYKVIVAGGRDFHDYQLMVRKLDYLLAEKLKTHRVIIVSGTAKGADRWGERYAVDHGLKVIRMPADWEKYGKRAGYIRNAEMAEIAEGLIAFHDGSSRGTASMIQLAISKKLNVRVVTY